MGNWVQFSGRKFDDEVSITDNATAAKKADRETFYFWDFDHLSIKHQLINLIRHCILIWKIKSSNFFVWITKGEISLSLPDHTSKTTFLTPDPILRVMRLSTFRSHRFHENIWSHEKLIILDSFSRSVGITYICKCF